MLEKIKEKLTPDFIHNLYSKYLGEGHSKGNNEYAFICPFHEENSPSFMVNINPENFGMYNCFGCNEIDTPQKKGTILTFLESVVKVDNPIEFLIHELGIEEKKTVPIIEIKEYKDKLWENQEALNILRGFGIRDEIIQEYDLGFKSSENRFWIPIKDVVGDFINVRRYDPFTKDAPKKMLSYKTGFGTAKLFPIQNLYKEDVFLFEGEKDCLVALSLGLNAITVTGGANTWKDEWNKLFKNKNVVICYDIDKAGIESSIRVAKKLHPFASQIKVISLPLSKEEFPKGDFTDWVGLQYTKIDFLRLVDETIVFTPISKVHDDIGDVFKCTLAEASKPFYAGKKCEMNNVLIVGRNKSPYQIPKKVKFRCTSTNKRKYCLSCPVNSNEYIKEISKKDFTLMELVDTSITNLESKLKKIIGIGNCTAVEIEVLEKYSIDKVELTSNTTYNIEEEYEYVKRTGYYVTDQYTEDSKKIETNKSYNIKAITISNPKDQITEHQIYDLEVADTNIDAFELTDEIHKQLKIFQVDTTIESKLKEIYNDFSLLARIYERNDLFLLYDLAFHSVLTFEFQGKNIGKGWVEVCVLGDSGVGKSEAVKFLIKHYSAGDFVDGETATLPGLKGALSQSNGTWNLEWGRLPINDRKLVVIDEASGLSIEDISALSNIRSSGECIVQKVVSDKTRSRTRLIWIANPRNQNTGIKDYSHGVETIKDFFGKPEDVRRVDVAMTCASGEVSIEKINTTYLPTIIKYNKDACHNLVLFAWSRKSTDIELSKDVEILLLQKAIIFSELYSSSIPLVEPSDIRNKLARLSVSLAIRLYSVNEVTKKIIVTTDHVEYICNWLHNIYSKPRFQYDSFSKKEFKKTKLLDIETVDNILRLDDIENIQELLDCAIISKQELADIMGISFNGPDFQKYLHRLKRLNAITIMDKRIKLNPCLLDYLRIKEKTTQKLKLAF